MKNPGRLITCVTMIVLVVSFSLSTAFATTISIRPSVSNQAVGSFFDVFVDIADVSDLYAFQFDISFDPAVLQAVGITEGPFLPVGGVTDFLPGTIDNAAGSISLIAGYLIGEVPGVNDSGHLAKLSFEAFGRGISLITLSNAILLDSNPADIPFTLNDGTVNVSTTVVPVPTTMLLLGFGLIGLAGVRRKFQK